MKHRPQFWLAVRALAIELADVESLGAWHCDRLRTWCEVGPGSRAFYVRRAEKLARELAGLGAAGPAPEPLFFG